MITYSWIRHIKQTMYKKHYKKFGKLNLLKENGKIVVETDEEERVRSRNCKD